MQYCRLGSFTFGTYLCRISMYLYTRQLGSSLQCGYKNAKNREPYNLDLEMIRPDGSIRWTNAFGGVQCDGNGKIIGRHGTVQDSTERKRGDEALRESRDRFEVTLASLDDAVFIVDPATRLISECNAAATRIFGYSREEMVGMVTNFLHVDQAHVEQFGREAGATYEDPGYYTREFEMRRKNGCVFPTEHFVRPVRDPNGRMLYTVSVVRDDRLLMIQHEGASCRATN
jgi:PAS domain S-box-containing protein